MITLGQKGEGHNYLTKVKIINNYELRYELYVQSVGDARPTCILLL